MPGDIYHYRRAIYFIGFDLKNANKENSLTSACLVQF